MKRPSLNNILRIFAPLLAAVPAMLGQCMLSPNTQGGSQYNEPPALTTLHYGQTIAQAWPQGFQVEYVQFSGTVNGYYSQWPPDFSTALGTAYGNWNGSSDTNNSMLLFSYYGVSNNGLSSVNPNTPNPSFQPWHQWTAVNQSDLESSTTLAQTSSQFENYGSTSAPFYALGTASTLASNAMSTTSSQSWEAHAFAHEIGHTMALDDCMLCQGGVGGTIMAYPSTFFKNSSLNITGPQTCDNQQTQQTAYPF
jgi:hypothetical protein